MINNMSKRHIHLIKKNIKFIILNMCKKNKNNFYIILL